jgi:F-type H+-transporting ATPase subunit gamma
MASFARVFIAQSFSPIGGSVRSYATLKDISVRLKAVKNIQKITKSMKMVAAAKYSRAERELKPARTYGTGAVALLDKAEILPEERKPTHLMICMSSDRGLCGGIHSNIFKTVRAILNERASAGVNTGLVLVGDKLRAVLQRTHRDKILMTFNEIGRLPPVFAEASFIAEQVLSMGYEFDSAEIFYNKFK